MRSKRCPGSLAILLLFLVPFAALAQGTLEDYQRAERFLPGNVRHLVSIADVNPHWIEKTNRFWYRRIGLTDTQFIQVDAEQKRDREWATRDSGRNAQRYRHYHHEEREEI